MQFHYNGFQIGDPEVAGGDTDRFAGTGPVRPLPGQVDVLIVGCGPAGLTLASQLAGFADISTCIIEQKPGPLQLGQADGIACRTMEMFNAFGFADRILREAYWVNETTFWRPADDGEGIVRGGWIQDTEPGLSEFPHVILNQARVHHFYLDHMRKAAAHLEPDYGWSFVGYEIDVAGNPDYPLKVTLQRADPADPLTSVIRAKYAVGCDGARSQVRRAMGLALKGDSANQAWGVMDVLPITNFPDVRKKSLVRAPGGGSIVLIPREGGFLTRMYVELDKLGKNERVSEREITLDEMIAAAERILQPFSFTVKDVAWWSIYEIGQRMCDRFDDAADEGGEPRVFIAGDACHTHSPKAGQGMNVSIQDGFNLGWKLAAVLRGLSPASLLKTYSSERHAIARELIEFDKEWAAMLSAPLKDPENPDGPGVTPEQIQSYFVKQGRYTAGVATFYKPNLLVGDDRYQALAEGFPVGARFHSAPVVRLADARPLHLGHAFEADGRWRIFAFADSADPTDKASAIWSLCDFLGASASSPIVRHTAEGDDRDAFIDVRAIFQQGHHDIALEDTHAFLRPAKGRFGLPDPEKMFCPDFSQEDIFDARGIDRRRGCVVIARPDQYVAQVLPLDDYDAIAEFFAGFCLPAMRK